MYVILWSFLVLSVEANMVTLEVCVTVNVTGCQCAGVIHMLNAFDPRQDAAFMLIYILKVAFNFLQ